MKNNSYECLAFFLSYSILVLILLSFVISSFLRVKKDSYIKKIGYYYIKKHRDKFVIKLFNKIPVKVKDIHVGYGGDEIHVVLFYNIEDCERVLENCKITWDKINWSQISDLGIEYNWSDDKYY